MGNTNARIDALDHYHIPHDSMGNIDMDEWASRFDAVIDSNELIKTIDGEQFRAVSTSSGYGDGWSTWNKGLISPVDARNNLFILTVKEIFKSLPEGSIQKVSEEELERLFFLTHPDIDSEENYVFLHGITRGVCVEWINRDKKFIVEWGDRNSNFIVDKFSGAESIIFSDEIEWL